MAISEHVTELDKGAIRWNQWGRESGSLVGPTLSNTNLAALGSYRVNDLGVKNGLTDLPRGYQGGASGCRHCGSKNISGVKITPTADDADPNIICLDCEIWWD